LAVAGRGDRGADAQAQHLVRTARWSPKYHTADLRHEITRRLKERIMFGADYPLLTYERLVSDWKAQNYPQEVLDNIFHHNAMAFFESLKT